MKRSLKVLLFILAACILVSGCSGDRRSTGGEAPGSEKIKLATTIFPVYEFARNIGGDRVEVYNLLPPGAEPHHWEPNPRDLIRINDAQLFVYCGAGLEPWVESILKNTDRSRLTVVDTSKGVQLLEGGGDRHDESQSGGVEDSGVHQKEEHDHSGTDPHIWLDPANAGIMVDNILEGLVQADPAGKEYYTENAKKYRASLADLDGRYRDALAGAGQKHLVVSHDAFGYMAHRYGLEQLSIRELSADSEPSPARMAEIVGLVKKYRIKYIFSETMISPAVSEAIAREAGVKTLVLNPIDGLSEKEIAGGKSYLSIMEENLSNLKIACEVR